MELKREGTILLDKITLSGFTVTDIKDPDLLLNHGWLTIKEGVEKYLYTLDGCRYNEILIKNDDSGLFDYFLYELRTDGHCSRRLEMSVPDDGYHNLNCLTVQEWQERILLLQSLMESRYGIILNFEELKFKTMEINKTILLDSPYNTYSRPLTLMTYLFPRQLRLKNINESSRPIMHDGHKEPGYRKDIETLHRTSGRKGLDLKIYDKTAQLWSKFKIKAKHDFLRFEITLNSSSKIKTAFGTCNVAEFTDEMVRQYFNMFIQENVVKPYGKHCAFRDKYLRNLLKKNYQYRSHKWVAAVLIEISFREQNDGVPIMLDLDELLHVIDNDGIPFPKDAKTKKSNARGNAKRSFTKCSASLQSAWTNGDGAKYQELLGKLA